MKPLLFLFGALVPALAIETPAYETIEKEGSFEIRKYGSIQVVSVPMDGMENRNNSFGKLFQYISGENATDSKIAMTAPVFMDEGKDTKADSGMMSFVLPSKVAEAGAPAPRQDGVKITTVEGGTFAILTFKGWSKDEQRKEASSKLEELIADRKLNSVSNPFFALYDPPWKPEFLRQNEVWLRLKTE